MLLPDCGGTMRLPGHNSDENAEPSVGHHQLFAVRISSANRPAR